MVPPRKMPQYGAGDARLKTRQSKLKPKKVWPDDDEKSTKNNAGSGCSIVARAIGLCGGAESGEASEAESGSAEYAAACTDTDATRGADSDRAGESAGGESAAHERYAGAHHGEFEFGDFAGDGKGSLGRVGARFEARRVSRV